MADVYGTFVQARAQAGTTEPDMQELHNHWLALLRFLHVQYKGYTLNVAPPPARPLAASLLADAKLNTLREMALKSQAEGQWVNALEYWSKIIQGGAGERRREAMLSRVYALRQTGEDFLAEQQLRGMALYADDEALKQAALVKLIESYRKANDDAGLQFLLAAVTDMNPSRDNLRALSAAMMANSDYEMALMAALAANDNTAATDIILPASYKLGWWEVFEAALQRVPDEKERAFWRAQREIESGHYVQAEKQFELAGETGKSWLNALHNGMRIHDELSSGERTQSSKLESLHAWQEWQAGHPGEYAWQEAAELVADYAGADMLYSIERDTYEKVFKATSQKPLRLTFSGPLRLRLETRPLYPESQNNPLDGWLEIRENGLLRLLPINNNIPTEGLRLVGQPLASAGIKAASEFEFGPGLHQVELSSKQATMLLRVFANRPLLPLGVLPQLAPETISNFKLADFSSTKTGLANCYCRNCLTMVSNDQLKPARSVQLKGQFPGPWLEQQGTAAPNPNQAEQETTNAAQSVVVSSASGAGKTALGWPEAGSLAAGDIEAALAAYPGQDDEAVMRRMLLLLWLAEQAPNQRERALTLGEALAASRPDLAQLQPLLARLSRNAGWVPVSNIQSSAGLRYIEVSGWQPESPALRVRRAMLTPVIADEQVISGTGRMVLVMTNPVPAQIQAEVLVEDLEYMRPLALTAEYQIDDLMPVAVELPLSQTHKSITLNIPAGKHALRIGIRNPVTNQFLKIRLKEHGVSELYRSLELPYEVATRNEPLIMGISGPAWLKIDELRDGKVVTDYRLVAPGFQTLKFVPESGRQEALLRISQRMTLPGDHTVPSRNMPLHPEAVPEPMLNLAYTPPVSTVALHDGFDLGGQEDGTWSVTGSYNGRRDIVENTGKADLERYIELGLTHRYYDENRRTYFKTDLLQHSREYGSPTLGIRETIDFRPVWAPLTFKLEGSLYTQNIKPSTGTDTQWADIVAFPLNANFNNQEWATYLRGSVSQKRDIDPKTWHLPELAVFERQLSLTDVRGYDGKMLDQDVYTQYKADHRHGLSLGDTLVHRPWLDTLWSANVSTHSNTDWNALNPDHITFGAGWKQLLGEVQIGLDYQVNRLFADENRVDTINRSALSLDMSWQHWRVNQQRFEVGLKLRHDIEQSVESGMLYVTWHFGQGRMYRDFRPGEVDFLDIRQRLIPQQINNSIKDAGRD